MVQSNHISSLQRDHLKFVQERWNGRVMSMAVSIAPTKQLTGTFTSSRLLSDSEVPVCLLPNMFSTMSRGLFTQSCVEDIVGE